jgi:hypothetical protein
MKNCPTCNRTYPDDAQVFCLMDGSVLSAPYDPSETRAAPRRSSEPPPTEVFRAAVEPAEVRAPLQSTIRALVPEVPNLHKPQATVHAPEQSFSVPLPFRVALALRGILAMLTIIPWVSLRGWGLMWNMHALFAGVLSLTAGVTMYVKYKRGMFFLADTIIALIVAVAFFASSQWPYWTSSWPIVSGTMLIAAAIELRKRVSQIWLLALAGLIFGLYAAISFIQLEIPYSDFSYAALIYLRATTAFIYGSLLAAFGFATRGRPLSHSH